MTHRAEPHCRVCSTGPCYDDDLVAPCSCSGEQRWVHSRCLEGWRAKSDDPHRCEACGAQYHLTPSPPQPRHRRRRAWWQPALLALGVAALAVGGFFWAEVSGRRRQEAARRREARERRARMREQKQLLRLVEQELSLVKANLDLVQRFAREGKLQYLEGWEALLEASAALSRDAGVGAGSEEDEHHHHHHQQQDAAGGQGQGPAGQAPAAQQQQEQQKRGRRRRRRGSQPVEEQQGQRTQQQQEQTPLSVQQDRGQQQQPPPQLLLWPEVGALDLGAAAAAQPIHAASPTPPLVPPLS